MSDTPYSSDAEFDAIPSATEERAALAAERARTTTASAW
jgi:hypothetical protein